MTPSGHSHRLVLPDDFADYAYEVEAKGVFTEARLRAGDRTFHLTFYDPVRLGQDIAAELSDGDLFLEPNLIVVRSVTVEEMRAAVDHLVRTGQLDTLVAG